MSYTGTEVFERAIVVLDELSDTGEVECIDRCHLASRYQAEQAVAKYICITTAGVFMLRLTICHR